MHNSHSQVNTPSVGLYHMGQQTSISEIIHSSKAFIAPLSKPMQAKLLRRKLALVLFRYNLSLYISNSYTVDYLRI